MALLLMWACGASACGGCSDPVEQEDMGDYFTPVGLGRYTPMRAPELRAPGRVDFGQLVRGERVTRIIEVSNAGSAPLHISDWLLEDPSFTVSFPDFMSGEVPRELAPRETVRVEVTHVARSSAEGVRAELHILSDDPKASRFTVTLTANLELPCLEISPLRHDFGFVPPGEQQGERFELHNCAERAATRVSIEALPQGGASSPFQWRGEVSEARVLEAGEVMELWMDFAPREPGEYADRFVVRSDVDGERVHEVEVTGRGIPYDCPEAVIVAQNMARPEVSVVAAPRGSYQGLPLDLLSLDASRSHSADGSPLARMEWSLVQRPTDSGASFKFGSHAERNELFLDLTGEYLVRLEVWDERGVRSCRPAELELQAVPDEDVHIQLVWDTPNDEQQHDNRGSDVDLHLLRDGGIWNDEPGDCFWQSLSPDWGVPFDASDDPSLDIDDVNGWGPENINLNNPAAGDRYHVGVHYFTDQGYGASYATVRLYLGGVLVEELRRKRIVSQQFWHAFELQWPSRRVVEHDRIYDTFPRGPFSP